MGGRVLGVDGSGPLDFRTIDFERLWSGRARTTDVELGALAELLDGSDPRRVLEIGPGGGRISPLLQRRCAEYLGVDLTPEFLEVLRARPGPPATWLAGDVERVPLRSGSVTVAVMVRVYDFLPRPALALRELARVVAPGGSVILSSFPGASVGMLADGLRRRIASGENDPGPLGALRARHPGREAIRAMARAASLRPSAERGVGFEDLRPLRLLPTAAFLGLARAFPSSRAFPHWFLRLDRPGAPPAELPRVADALQCPNCGTPISGAAGGRAPAPCPGCRRAFAVTGGIVDLRPS